MPALQLRLPDVVMAVDEAGTDDLVCAVDNFGVGVRGDGFADFGDRCASNEEVGMVKDLYIVSMVVNEEDAVLEENGMGRCI